jgi:isopentenyl diphosphate isomerase/L-lactate dehydrogenase-like FMN-dependent dehydrogenase
VKPVFELLGRQVADDLRAFPGVAAGYFSDDARAQRCLDIADCRRAARRAIPGAIFDFVDGAANDEVTARANCSDFDRLRISPRALVDVSNVDMSTSVLGQRVSLPILGAPTGLTGLVHHRGEAAVATALHAAGSVYVLSAVASYSIEEMAELAPGPRWFQLYTWRDRGLVQELLARAQAAGYSALVVTVDVPLAARRMRDVRNGFGTPPRVTARSLGEALLRPRWTRDFVRRPRAEMANLVGRGAAAGDSVTLATYLNTQFDPTLSWSDLEWLRGVWSGPIVVKGILRPEDATQAVDAGAAGIGVSNHGGRQLDHAPSAITALPAVVDAVGDRAEVFVDGGVRRGSDVLKAIALGARACLVGRALLYGLAAAGDAGAARALTILSDELKLALALAGCQSLDQLDASWVVAA